MFLHLGSDTVIPVKNIIAIFDLKLTKAAVNDTFIKNRRREQKIVDVGEGSPKTFVITDDAIYLSAISSNTLKKRAGKIPEDE